MLPAGFTDFFLASSGATGALIGLLFVAVSVTPEKLTSKETGVVSQIHAATALLCFTDVLAVSLFALIPGNDPGHAAAAFGIVGLVFAAASARSVLSRHVGLWRSLLLITGMTALFGLQTAYGFDAAAHHASQGPLGSMCLMLVIALLVGVARAWQLVGLRDTGPLASLGVLVRGDRDDSEG